MSTTLFSSDSERIKQLVQIVPETTFLEYLDSLENFGIFSVYLIEIIDEFFAFRDSISGKFDNPVTEKTISSFEKHLHTLCTLTESISFPVENDLQHRSLKTEATANEKKELITSITNVRNGYRTILQRSLQKPRRETSELVYSHGVLYYNDNKMTLESPARIALMDLLWSSRAISKTKAHSISLDVVNKITTWNLTNIRGNIKSFNDDMESNELPLKFAFSKSKLVLIYTKGTKTL